LDELKGINFRQTNLYLDSEVVFLATQKLTGMTGNKRMLSAFVNQILEEFVLEGEERPETTIRQKARQLSEQVRKDKLSQRKLINDAETQKIEKIQQEAERKTHIERETRRAVQKLQFKPEWLRDTRGLNFSHHRKEITDEVSFACRLDLQWKDIFPVVSAAVLGDQGETA
jgi:hypothetical protein